MGENKRKKRRAEGEQAETARNLRNMKILNIKLRNIIKTAPSSKYEYNGEIV